MVFVISLLALTSASAEIYKWVMPDGSIHYSDRPQEQGATKVELPQLQTYTAPNVSPVKNRSSSAPNVFAGYQDFKVAKPADGETIRDNGGSVSVSLSLTPGLQRGHIVEIMMGGKVLGSGRSTSLTLTNVDRGSHRVDAVIKDNEGKEVARATGATFHLKRAAKKN